MTSLEYRNSRILPVWQLLIIIEREREREFLVYTVSVEPDEVGCGSSNTYKWMDIPTRDTPNISMLFASVLAFIAADDYFCSWNDVSSLHELFSVYYLSILLFTSFIHVHTFYIVLTCLVSTAYCMYIYVVWLLWLSPRPGTEPISGSWSEGNHLRSTCWRDTCWLFFSGYRRVLKRRLLMGSLLRCKVHDSLDLDNIAPSYGFHSTLVVLVLISEILYYIPSSFCLIYKFSFCFR